MYQPQITVTHRFKRQIQHCLSQAKIGDCVMQEEHWSYNIGHLRIGDLRLVIMIGSFGSVRVALVSWATPVSNGTVVNYPQFKQVVSCKIGAK
jgi:hypothetical protein